MLLIFYFPDVPMVCLPNRKSTPLRAEEGSWGNEMLLPEWYIIYTSRCHTSPGVRVKCHGQDVIHGTYLLEIQQSCQICYVHVLLFEWFMIL